jgi:hypothetical protein
MTRLTPKIQEIVQKEHLKIGLGLIDLKFPRKIQREPTIFRSGLGGQKEFYFRPRIPDQGEIGKN